MDKKRTSSELSQAELPPAQEEQLDSDDDAEPRAKRARTTRPTSEPAQLTRKNLALFNKRGKKKSSDPSDDSGSTKTISTTSTVGEAPNEATVVGEMLPLLKRYPKGYKRALNQAFTAFPSKVGFNNGLSAPQPDYVEGLGMEEYRPFPVDKHVNGAVLYKDNPRSVTLPHLAGEWKGPGGDMREATLQSGYDGAALVYARNQALAFQGESDPPGHANITTFTTNGTQVHFYAHYATPTEDGALEYHQFPVKSTSLVNSHGEHKEGRRGLRNAQDHARAQSYALKDQLKEHYKQQRGSGLNPVAEEMPPLPIPGIEPLDAYEDERRLRSRRTTACLPADTPYIVQAKAQQIAPLAFDAAFVEGPLIHTQFHPQQRWQAKSFVLTVVPRVFRTCQQAQKLLEEGRQERTLLPQAFGWYRLLA
ncbi:hypothetical protein B0T16DRAFT_440595 [Cercophora newfieldiana]|uniref:DUF7924 domain-containing protein n=1 Tax=Cercophora newfieldiana TaxID=92897 RepID=A0AA39YMM3_9PEZI|nr:hypothetical protein B0T16DRAFT_440595 [Cercophora newfieldiana]